MFLSDLGSTLFFAQMANWLPVWLTPIWVLSLGLLFGAIAAAVILGIFAILSFTPLGKIADSPKAGLTASLGLGAVLSAVLCAIYATRPGEFQGMLILPLISLGLVMGFAIVYGVWHRTRAELKSIVGEGIVPYVLGTAGLFSVVGLLSTPLVSDPNSIIGSVWQVNLFSDGTEKVVRPVQPIAIDANPDEAAFQPVPMEYVMSNVAELTITSDKTIIIADAPSAAQFQMTPVRINAGETVRYLREDREAPPLPINPALVHMQNREIDPATVTMTFVNRPTVPEASSIATTAISFLIFILGYIALRQAAPRVSAVALSTAKSEMAQPLYLLLLLLGIFGMLLFGIMPFNTLGEDIRLMKDSAVTLIMVLGMLQAVWSAGTSISEEIEGRTALTVLSKPLSRRSFLIGKYIGIMFSVLVLFVIIGAVLMMVLSYKPIYDARETTRVVPVWQIGHEELVTTVPALVLYFMEAMAIGGIAVALATRLPLLANFVVCFVVYVIGNLTAPLVRSTNGENELVGFVGKLIAVVVPNLNTFNVQSAIDASNQIPPIYLAGAFNYLFCFIVMILMVAMLMFEDRDLA
jgi:hypothetical protein